MKFDVEKLKAIEHTGSPLLVTAGPGSGKTRVITERIKFLIKSGLKPSEILCLTFSEKAANELKQRLQDDTSQIDYYKQITKNMPGKVLRKNKVVTYQDDKFILNSPNFTDEQRKNLIKICNEKVKKYQEKWGEKIWIHRARSSRVIPGSMRYTVLKNAKNRCELCGIHKDEKALDVDHIVPINKGGPNVIENMQALCYTCNSQKGDRDSTDFRLWQGMYEKKEKRCIFCKPDKIEIENSLAFTVKDGYPVTSLHYLVIPKRHISSFFELGSSEHKACLNLLEETKKKNS